MTHQAWEEIYAGGQQLNRFAFSEIVSFYFRHRAELAKDSPRALDVGCGSGVHCNFLARQGIAVLGIDFSPAAIDAARAAYPSDNITFQVADFATFEAGEPGFDLVVDRCATTHSTVPTAVQFYHRLRTSLQPGARLFWQGFAWDNSGRDFGRDVGDGSWADFSDGVFADLGRTAFFKESDLADLFQGYRVLAVRHLSDRDVTTGYNHTSWIVEAEYDGQV